MITTIFILAIILGFMIFIKTSFDKKYNNSKIQAFMKRSFWICVYLLPFICFIFIKDLSHPHMPNNASGSYALGIALITFISPILIIIGFLKLFPMHMNSLALFKQVICHRLDKSLGHGAIWSGCNCNSQNLNKKLTLTLLSYD